MQNILDGLRKISSAKQGSQKLEEDIFRLIQDSIPDFNEYNIEDLSSLLDKDYLPGDVFSFVGMGRGIDSDVCRYSAGDMYTVNNRGEGLFLDRALSKIYDPAIDEYTIDRHCGKITFSIPYEQERTLPELDIAETDIQTINKFIMSAMLQKEPDVICDEINSDTINTAYRYIECHDIIVKRVLMNPFDFIDFKQRASDFIDADYLWTGKINTTMLMPVGKVALFSDPDISGVIAVNNDTKAVKAIMINGQGFALLSQRQDRSS